MEDPVDLFIIGGGVNGCGIARDAAGRGLSVVLAEMGDLAQGTSSASTKMFHGGLRYLEYYEFRLVREALKEREILLRAMPHIAWPMRFVLPYNKGLRPAWLIRLGLFIYDHLGGRKILPATRTLKLREHPAGLLLKKKFTKGFEYSDCWVQDARLVVLNARDAKDRGADIRTRTKVVAAKRQSDVWEITVERDGKTEIIFSKCLVNAAGPWVGDVIADTLKLQTNDKVRLVRGSHIVTKKLYDHDWTYFFQNSDGRIGFVIPFEEDFTLIGTTDQEQTEDPLNAYCTNEETEYLLDFVSEYLEHPVHKDDIVWSYSGVRALYDDGVSSATEATRDYVLSLDTDGPPLLSIFGGKITTYRRLAESAMSKLSEYFPHISQNWTAGVALPGGDFPVEGSSDLVAAALARYSFLSAAWARRLVRCYGTEVGFVLGEADSVDDLGIDFGGTLREAEVRWLVDKEFAYDAEDILWRRTKLGLRVSEDQALALQEWLDSNR